MSQYTTVSRYDDYEGVKKGLLRRAIGGMALAATGTMVFGTSTYLAIAGGSFEPLIKAAMTNNSGPPYLASSLGIIGTVVACFTLMPTVASAIHFWDTIRDYRDFKAGGLSGTPETRAEIVKGI